ncbi:MAG: lamin tail domain-containing protein [Ignavibacteriaceae bacterium]
MGKILFLFLFLPTIISAQSERDIILSEIMFAPQSGNNEFIELYNTSETESIDLSSYKIKYQTSNPDIFESTGSGTILPPESFAVIFEGDYDLSSGIYKDLVPSSALVLKTGDNSFGSSGMSNSSDRTLLLMNYMDEILETYTYTSDNKNGISDEKIILNNDTAQNNWTNSIIVNGTPGFKNSVTPLRFDIAFGSISAAPLIPLKDDDVNISIEIKNNGTETVENYSIEIFHDLNQDSSGSPSELIYQNSYLNLPPKDSNNIKVQITSVNEGIYNLILNIICNNDENLKNNSEYFHFIVHPPANNYNDLVINEIMYAPVNGEPEWIEIYNKSASSINLNSWKFSDANATISPIKEDKFLEPGSYLIISKDSAIINFYSIPCEIIVTNLQSLNNSGDAAVIKDSLGTLIDSIYYFPSWGGSNGGNSLERISTEGESNDEENWKTSEGRFNGTPGKINSVSIKNYDLSVTVIKPLKDYVMVGDQFQFNLKVKNIGINSSSNFTIKIFNDLNKDSLTQDNELIKQIYSSSIESKDSLLFSLNLNNIVKGENYFIVSVETEIDDDPENNKAFLQITGIEINEVRNDIIINEIMYNPLNSEPEWIELYNRSTKTIDLRNYSVADERDTVRIIENSVLLKAGEYFVIADDSSISGFYNVDFKYQINNLPSLNNSFDKIILLDSLNRVIDSLEYYSSWGGNEGKSLERINAGKSAIDSSNWKTSEDKLNGTPGKINSATQKDFDVAVTGILFTPELPVSNDDVIISAKILNFGKIDAIINLKLYEDTNLDSLPDVLINSVSDLNLTAGDSAVVPMNYVINDLHNIRGFYIGAVYPQDQDTSNNKLYSTIRPGYSERAIVINEIMYSPAADEPEWIELLNISIDTLNFKGWTVSDLLPQSSKKIIAGADLFIAPDEYLIIAHDSSFFNIHPEVEGKIKAVNFGTLGNSEDGIVIYDFQGNLIDSIKYKSSWGGKNGCSLERFSSDSPSNDSTNWGSSLSEDKSSPGKENSIINIPAYNKNDLVINEIMFDPEIDNSEFIEFFNCSNSKINIGGWKIEDASGNFYKLSDINFFLSPNDFFVLAADSLIFNNYNLSGFNNINILNSGNLGLSKDETIILKDLKGNIIDSVIYNEGWHNKNFSSTKNISLEKINPFLEGNNYLNWNSSVNTSGATPGKMNSIFSENKHSENKISISPNPFSPDNDGFEDFTIINYALSQNTSQVRIKIFDNRGRLLRTLLNNQPSGSKGSVVFDGLEEDGTPFRMGIYIIFLESLNEITGVSETLKTVVVVARKL